MVTIWAHKLIAAKCQMPNVPDTTDTNTQTHMENSEMECIDNGWIKMIWKRAMVSFPLILIFIWFVCVRAYDLVYVCSVFTINICKMDPHSTCAFK